MSASVRAEWMKPVQASIPSPVLADTFDLDAGIDLARVGGKSIHVEIEMRKQVHLGDQEQVRTSDHVGVFQRLILALGHGDEHHAMLFAEVEHGRADEIADIFDEEHRAEGRP